MKKIFLLLIAIFILGFTNLNAQTCNAEKGYNDFPFTANGITVDKSLTGNFTTYSSAYEACGITEKAYSIWTGQNGPATFKTTFSIALNDIMYNLAGSNTTEAFTVTVSDGTPSISIVECSCPGAWTISGNVLTCSNDGAASGNAGARIKIHSTVPYTWINFAHNGGAGGTIFTMCFDAAYESVQPTVTTTTATSVTGNSASSGGDVTADGGSAVIARGVCWNTAGTPTIANNFTSDGSGTGAFTSSISSLSAGTTYYVRAYATNANGTAYGSQLSFTTSSTPPPTDPTSISASLNPICNGTSTQLTANGAVGTVYWYTSSCGGTLVTTGNPITVSPSSTTTYYARNYNNSLYSSGCASVTVTAYSALTAGISGGSSPICYNTSPGTYTATGGGGTSSYTYLWYKNGASTGVTTQTYSPGSLAATSSFYCAITSGSCGTVNTTTTTITVYGDLTAGISGGFSPLCYNTAPGTFTATGGGGTGSYTYLWYKNSVSTGVTTQTYTPGNLTITSAIYCAITSGSCGTVNTSSTTITVYGNLSAIISGGTSPLCYNTAPGTLTATGGGGNSSYTYLWYKNGTSTGITTQTYTPGNLSATSTFYCAITSGSCGTVNSSTTTITVYSDLTAGISGGITPLCYNTAPGTLTATGGGGTGFYTYLWYKDGSTTGVTTQTYAPGNLTATSTFYCEITSGTCGTVSTTSTTITVYPEFANGSILTTGDMICFDSDPVVIESLTAANGGDGTITYQWQSSVDAAFTSPVTIESSNSASYDPPTGLKVTTWYRRQVKDGSCTGFVSSDGVWKVTVSDKFMASVVSSDQTICWNTTAGKLNASSSTGGSGSYSYQWQVSADGNVWADIPGETNLSLFPGDLYTTNYYRILSTDIGTLSCGSLQASNTITITVRDPFTPSVLGVAGNQNIICYSSAPGLLTATPTLGGSGPVYTYQWQSKTTGNWVNVGTNSLTYQPGNLTANTQFRLIAFDNGSPACGSVYSLNTVSITVQSAPNAGSIGSDQTICAETTPSALTSITNGSTTTPNATIAYKWEYSITNGSEWTLIGSATGAGYAPGVLTQTTLYRRTTISTLNGYACESVPVQVTITVGALPTAFAGGNQTICSTGTATISGASAENGTFLWTENGAGSITSGETTLTPTYSASAEDAGKAVTLTMTVSSNNVCSPQAAVAEYTVNVDALPTAQAGGSQTICSNGMVVVSDASSSNGTILWTENGAGILTGETTLTPTYTASAEDAGKMVTLTMTVSSSNVCSPQSAVAEYTVLVDPLPTAVAGGNQTICSGGIAVIDGASSSNGIILWTSDGAGSLTGETTLTPTYVTADADAGKLVTLTMTVTSENNCSPQVAAASYSIIVRPAFVSPVVSSNQQICYSNSAAPLVATEANGGTGGYTYQWQYSADGETNWMNVDEANSLSYSPGILMETSAYRLLATDAGIPSCATEVASNVVTVLVNAPLYPPIVSGGSDQPTVCYNGIPAVFTAIDATGGTGPFSYQWQMSRSGLSNWTNVGQNTIGNTTYQAPATIENTYYRVIAKDVGMPSCGSTFSNALLVTVQAVPAAGAISADQTICGGTAPVALTSILDGTGSGTISYKWDYSLDGDIWNPADNAEATYAVGELTQTTWFRRATVSTLNEMVCESEFTTPVKIEVLFPAAITGEDREICPGTSTVIGAAAVEGSTYSWSSTPGEFTSFEANPTVEPMETTTYVVVETYTATGCTNTNSVVVTVNSLPLPTITGSALIGSGVSGSEYTTEPGFTGYTWTVSSGGIITSGEGTNSILVSWTESGNQTVSVIYRNEVGCEPLLPTLFNVLVTPVPDAAVITQDGLTLISDAPTGNQWYRDGVAIEGATGAEFTITESGTYYVIVTINGSSSPASNSIVVLFDAINDLELSHTFDVYPNPSKGQFNIKVTSAKPIELNIEIYNAIGVLIWKQEKVKIDGTFIVPVNLKVVPNGAYLITLRNTNIAVSRRVVIMK
jgi:hypothetical protein